MSSKAMWEKGLLLQKNNSKISGEIKVVQYKDEVRLIVGGYTQSVYMPRNNWDKLENRVWGQFLSKPLVASILRSPCRILLLGLGGATVGHLIQQGYGPLPLEAIELDPEIVNIGKKFFHLEELKNLNITIGDAFVIVKNNLFPVAGKQYDFVIVDAFIGGNFSHEEIFSEYATAIKNLLSDKGIAVFNILHKKDTVGVKEKHLDKLIKIFNRVHTRLVPGLADKDNLLIFCSP